jgi:hypothetical protein
LSVMASPGPRDFADRFYNGQTNGRYCSPANSEGERDAPFHSPRMPD